MDIASALAISAVLSSTAFSATLISDNLDYTGTPLAYTVNPVTSDPIIFPALVLEKGTVFAGNLHYYFGNCGTATSGVTKNKGSVAFTAGSITGATTAIPGSFTYTSAEKFCGVDTFTYRIHDSSDDIDTLVYTVTLRVGDPLNVGIQFQDIPFTLTPTARILSNFTAVGGVSPYIYVVNDLPTCGTLTQNDDSSVSVGVALTSFPPKYTPNNLYCRQDHFCYTIMDSSVLPEIVSSRFEINVQGQGFSAVPGEEVSTIGQITGSGMLMVDGDGTLIVNNTQLNAQNNFSGGTLINSSTVVLKNVPYVYRTTIDLR